MAFAGLIASRLAPTGFVSDHTLVIDNNPVGASLLAMNDASV